MGKWENKKLRKIIGNEKKFNFFQFFKAIFLSEKI